MRTRITLVFLITIGTALGQTTKKMSQFDSNFAHTVYFWLKNPDSPTDRQSFETSLRTFLLESLPEPVGMWLMVPLRIR
jgi:hypothetical protein